MSAIITSALSSTLKIFLKDYNKQQLNLKLFGGEVTLDSIKIDEKVIHELLHFPQILEIKSITCESLRIKIPWTNFKHEPITVHLSGINMDIKESFEPVCYPPNKKLEDFMSKVKGGINSKKDKDKDKSFVNKLLEDMTVNITDVNGSISFLSTDRLSDGPSISFNLASLMLRSTDSQWNVVDLAKIHEIPKGSRHYFMHKEIFIGSLVASVNDPFHPYVDFVKTQPVSLRAKIKYAVGSDRILDVDITSELSLIKINVNKNCVSSFMSAVNSLLWCLQYSTMQQNGNTDGNSADKSTDSDSEDENDSGTGEDLTLSESVLTKSENALDESMVTAKDEYLNTLKKEYAEAESLFSDDSMSSGVLPTMHVMLKMDQFVFNVEGVIRLEVHKVAACGLVESEFTGALNASGGGGSGEPSMTGSLLGSTYTVEFSLGNVSLYSLVPSAKNAPLIYTKETPFVKTNLKYKGGLMKKRNVEGLNSLEIVGTTSYFEFLIEPQVVSSLLDFVGMGFSLRKLQESKSDVSLSSVLWFVNSSKVNFDCAGMKLKVVESCDAPNNAFAINIGRIFVEEFPSQELLSSYSSEGSVDLTSKTFDEDASLSLPLVNDSSKPAEKPSSPTKAKDLPEAQPETPSFNLITLNINISNFWIGAQIGDKEEYLIKPFDINTEIHMFQPISLICSFLRKTSISDLEKEQEITSEDQLAAISFDAFMISHSVHTIYGYVLPFIMLSDQINGLLATLSSKQEGKDPALAKSPALNEEAKSMKHVKIKKAMKKVKRRADVLKKVMELRLATAALPFRIFASGGIEKIEVSLNCNEEVIGYIADNAVKINKSIKESGNHAIVLDFVERVLSMVTTGEEEGTIGRDIRFVSVEFLSTEASFNYSPPIPPSLSSVLLIASKDSANSSPSSRNEDDNDDDDDDEIKEGVTVEANVNLRDFRVLVAPSKALPLEVKVVPQNKAEWLLDTSSVGGGSNENEGEDEDEDESELAMPTDVILAKYRLEYSEEQNEDPKHFITLSVSGVRVETDGAMNPVMDFVKRSSNPDLFKQQQQQQGSLKGSFGDGVNLDIQLCDIDFVHDDTKARSPLRASFKLLPRSEAGILYLRDKFTYKTTQMRIKHEKDIATLNTVIDKTKKEVAGLEQMLIESKISLATLATESEERACTARRLQREKRALENRVQQLTQEVEAFNKLLKAKNGAEMEREFQNSLKNLFEENARYSKENDALRAENERLLKQLEDTRMKNQEEIASLQRAKEDSVAMLVEENTRLKEVVASRDKSLSEAQKGFLDRQLLAEKLSEAERKMDTQRRIADNAIRKSSFRASGTPTVVVTQKMLSAASPAPSPAPAVPVRTITVDEDSSKSGVTLPPTPEELSAIESTQRQQQQAQFPQKPTSRPPPPPPPPLPQSKPPRRPRLQQPHLSPPSTLPPPPPPPSQPAVNTTQQQSQQLPPRPRKSFATHPMNDDDEADEHSKRKKIANGFDRFKKHIGNGVNKIESKRWKKEDEKP